MPSSIQKRAILGKDYNSLTGKDGTVDKYECTHCSYQTYSKGYHLSPNEPKRNAVNRIRGEIMIHVKEKHT